MVRSTRILHKNKEYLIQEKGVSSAGRTITFLSRPEYTAEFDADTTLTIKTNHGEWVPIAKWEKEKITILHKGSKDLAPTLESILKDYLGQQSGKGPKKRYYYFELNGLLRFSLSPAHPNGLAVKLYSSKKLAQESHLNGSLTGDSEKVRQTDDVKEFLIKAADDGYAGAILNDAEPIYFCLDTAENMVFLRLSMNEEEEVEEFLLKDDGKWARYDGESDIEFYLDQDKCDRNMVDYLGEIPFLGCEDIQALWTLEEADQTGKPFILSGEEGPFEGMPGGAAMILFRGKESAGKFLIDYGLVQCEAVQVEDLRSLLKIARRQDLSVMLEPFSHRANGGSMWLNGEDVILDTFSGFWILEDGWTFSRAD